MSAEFIVNSNLPLPQTLPCLFKAQKPGILDPYLATVSCSTGACYKLQADAISCQIS